MQTSFSNIIDNATTFLANTHLTLELKGKHAMITVIAVCGMGLTAFALKCNSRSDSPTDPEVGQHDKSNKADLTQEGDRSQKPSPSVFAS